MANDQWYYAADGQRIGPVSETEIRALIDSGKITAETLVWKAPMENWVEARHVPQLWTAQGPVGSPLAMPPTGAPPAGPADQQLSGFAIASFVLGLMPCTCIPSVLAIIFGHIALNQISKNPLQYKGRGFALWGTGLGYFFTVVNIIYGIVVGIQTANM